MEIGVDEWPSSIIWKNGSLDPTWRIISFSKQLGSPPIYKPQISAIKGRGPTTPAGFVQLFFGNGKYILQNT